MPGIVYRGVCFVVRGACFVFRVLCVVFRVWCFVVCVLWCVFCVLSSWEPGALAQAFQQAVEIGPPVFLSVLADAHTFFFQFV